MIQYHNQMEVYDLLVALSVAKELRSTNQLRDKKLLTLNANAMSD